MAAAEEVQFCLKVMMMKESNKVLYAEVDNDFADVLLSFLTLPLGTIVRLLIKHYGNKAPIIGSLSSLYAGLLNLDSCHFWTEEGKLMLLNPRNSYGFQCSRLKLQIDDTPPATQCFACENFTCASMYYKMTCLCSTLRNIMTGRELEIEAQSADKSVFTAQTASFLLTDDLQILTNTSTSLLQVLKLNGIGDTSVLEERTLIFGLKEIMELLKRSLVSQTPITDVILSISSAAGTLNKRQKFSASTKYESDALPQTNENVSSDSKKIALKALVQKSTHRVLLAQTRHEFIDFLFSLLIIPLGRVQFLLGKSTCLGSINNLYRSISNWEDVDYMMSKEAVDALLDPQIPPYYLSSYQILSLNQQSSSAVHFRYKRGRYFYTTTPDLGSTPMKMIDPKGHDSFVKGRTMYMVTDDLVVSTPSSAFIISTLNRMKIPVSDVEEQELGIGIEEALSILKASLFSTSALSDGLKPFLMRQQKQEK
ncbi:uncharacterized protein [Primulina eburnea]